MVELAAPRRSVEGLYGTGGRKDRKLQLKCILNREASQSVDRGESAAPLPKRSPGRGLRVNLLESADVASAQVLRTRHANCADWVWNRPDLVLRNSYGRPIRGRLEFLSNNDGR
jgi:hypothetical protein